MIVFRQLVNGLYLHLTSAHTLHCTSAISYQKL